MNRSPLFLALLLACGDKASDDTAGTTPADDTAASADCPDGSAFSSWYADADSDGFGDVASTELACEAPAGMVADATDCDDGDPAIHPAAEDACDGVDNNCDGQTDEDMPTWYIDRDADGFGDPADSSQACEAPFLGVADGTDCNDDRDRLHPYDLDGDGVMDECGWHGLVAGGYHNCALDSDGETACWGLLRDGATTPPTGVSFVSLTGGAEQTCGIDDAGDVWC